MTTHEVACQIDDNEVEHWDNENHALMWHVAQANPADGFRDSGPGELVERIGREIGRRWLSDILSSSTPTKAATTTGKTCCSLGNWNTDGEFIPNERAMPAVVDDVPQHQRLT
jgi:hypothetical protein